MGDAGYHRQAWIDHYNDCQECHDGAELCATGAQLAAAVMAGMASYECLVCDL